MVYTPFSAYICYLILHAEMVVFTANCVYLAFYLQDECMS